NPRVQFGRLTGYHYITPALPPEPVFNDRGPVKPGRNPWRARATKACLASSYARTPRQLK
ncbi:MAG: hypothetical protein AAF683_14980, partial [Pseudomonadota bacterium]